MHTFSRPDCISTRLHAMALWAHLRDRRIVFHIEEDPAEWLTLDGRSALSDREVATFRRLVAEVDRLGAVTFECYADAERMRQLTLLEFLGDSASARAA